MRENDDIVLAGSRPIRLRRTYRNLDPQSRAFGIGTSHSYELYLVGDTREFKHIDLILADGARVRFDRTTPGAGVTDAVLVHTGTPTEFNQARLTSDGHGGDADLHDGSRYSFRACRGVDGHYTQFRRCRVAGHGDRIAPRGSRAHTRRGRERGHGESRVLSQRRPGARPESNGTSAHHRGARTWRD